MTLTLNNPIIVLLGNLYFHGVTVGVEDGQLRIGGETAKLSPAYRSEIKRRAEHLIDLLSPEVPEPLRPYFGRLLKVPDLILALGIAEQLQVRLTQTPVNGGWVILINPNPYPTAEASGKAKRKDKAK